nr:MAG TPA: hypothetical protein [Herelleviridae sp.]
MRKEYRREHYFLLFFKISLCYNLLYDVRRNYTSK